MTRRCTFLGFEWCWKEDRQGVPRVKRRTAGQKVPRACQRRQEGMQANRHVPGKAVFNSLNARLRGQYRDDEAHGRSTALSRVFDRAMSWACKWLNRHGGQQRRFSWQRFSTLLDAIPRERARLTEPRAEACMLERPPGAAVSPTAAPDAGTLHVRDSAGDAGYLASLPQKHLSFPCFQHRSYSLLPKSTQSASLAP
jgi:hypothetical protein